jgi:hypothetical protein
MIRFLIVFTVVAFSILMPPIAAAQTAVIIDHQCTFLLQIPTQWIDSAKSKLHIAYGHTSHGSQLIDGMSGLASWKGSQYNFNNGGTGGALDLHDYAMGGDVGYYPDWVNNTRTYLNTPANSDVNVIIWSWCGQASSKTAQSMIDEYLAPMTQLESDYPNVKFVYMTGHLDGGGSNGNLNVRNQQIRDYCQANKKVLYDFADIESYDPDGLVNYMELGANDNCDYDSSGVSKNWAIRWQNTHTENVDWYSCSAAHSQPLNGNRKAYAAWWLWARLAGWNSQTEVKKPEKYIPHNFNVLQNYPNPFNPSTVISYQLPGAGVGTQYIVSLNIYDMLGRQVQTLVNERQNSGNYSVTFNAANLSSGIYFYRLQAGNFIQTKKLMLVK